jgi:hypothetical protein
MTSTKTHNISTQLEKMKDHNTFYVSDSIKHLISEEILLDQVDSSQKAKFALSDLIAKVKLEDKIAYYDVVNYSIENSIKLKCDAHAISFFHQQTPVKIKLLLKNDPIQINLNCKFLEFDKISQSTYIYTLSICNR